MNIAVYIIILIVSYLIGSIPTAYLVVRRWSGKDVTSLGSGNIGTMNTHRATENKLLTVSVLLGDMAKGAVAVVLARLLLSSSPEAPILTSAAVVLGHNYSVYMGFKGGRGLATAAGAMLIFNPLILLLWLLIWVPPFLISKILVVGTLIATVLTPVVTYVLMITNTLGVDGRDVAYAVVISAIVMLRHISKIRMLINGTEPKKYWKIRQED